MRRTVSGENVRWRERKPPLRRWNLNLRRALPPSKMSARDVEKLVSGLAACPQLAETLGLRPKEGAPGKA